VFSGVATPQAVRGGALPAWAGEERKRPAAAEKLSRTAPPRTLDMMTGVWRCQFRKWIAPNVAAFPKRGT